MPFDEAVELCMSGELTDAKTVAAILKAKVLLVAVNCPCILSGFPLQSNQWARRVPRGRETPMSMNTKKNISIVLLVVALLLWLLRKMNVLYIPGLSMVLLVSSMIMVGIMMFQVKQKKEAGRHADPGLRPVLHRNGHDGDQGLFCVRNKGSTHSGAPLATPIPIFAKFSVFHSR